MGEKLYESVHRNVWKKRNALRNERCGGGGGCSGNMGTWEVVVDAEAPSSVARATTINVLYTYVVYGAFRSELSIYVNVFDFWRRCKYKSEKFSLRIPPYYYHIHRPRKKSPIRMIIPRDRVRNTQRTVDPEKKIKTFSIQRLKILKTRGDECTCTCQCTNHARSLLI